MSKLPLSQLAAVIAEQTLQTDDPSKIAKEVAAYLVAEKRVSELESILREVMFYREKHGIVEAQVASAHDLTDQVIADVKQLIEQEFSGAETIIVDQELDSSIVGGLRLNTSREQLDMTVKGRIDTFKRLITKGNI